MKKDGYLEKAELNAGHPEPGVISFETHEQRRRREQEAFAQAMGERGLGAAVPGRADAHGEGAEDDFSNQCGWVMRVMHGMLSAVPSLGAMDAGAAAPLMDAAAQAAQVYLNAAHALVDHEMTLEDRAERDRKIGEAMAHQARMEAHIEQAAARGQLLIPAPPGMHQ